MKSKQSLIVPIHIDALCVGEEDNKHRTSSFMSKTASFMAVPYKGGEIKRPNICDGAIVKSPFQKESLPFGEGIHLHWALPDAFTSANEGPDPENKQEDTIQFPIVPNRWLVTRVLTKTTDSTTAIKSWVVESDYLSRDVDEADNRRKITIPFYDGNDEDFPFRYMGRAVPLETWEEDSSAERFPDLTAIGYGDPGFAAYYPDCRSVFGFHDNFSDLVNYKSNKYKLSYMVIGWYSDLKNSASKQSSPDTLLKQACKEGKEKVEEYLEAMNWFVADNIDPENLDQIVCSGIVQDVNWGPEKPYIKDEKDLEISFANIAVGNTPDEGLSAVLPHIDKNEEPTKETEQNARLIETLQMDYLDKTNQVDASSQLEEAMHKNTFNAESTGIIWSITSIEDGKENLEVKEIRKHFAEDLNELNSLQSKYNQFINSLSLQKKQTFFDWWKFMKVLYLDKSDKTQNDLKIKGIGPSDIKDYVKAQIKDIDLNKEEELLKDISSKYEALESQLGDEFTLKTIGASRFYKPNEPVMVLASEELKPATKRYGKHRLINKKSFASADIDSEKIFKSLIKNRYIDEEGNILDKFSQLEDPSGLIFTMDVDINDKEIVFDILKNADSNKLECRVETQLISSFKVKFNKKIIKIDSTVLPKNSKNKLIPPVSDKLLAELFFIDYSHSKVLAEKLSSSEEDKKSLLDLIKKEQTDSSKFHKECLTGKLLNQWNKPWYPIFMHWEVSYWPFEKNVSQLEDKIHIQNYKRNFIINNFELSEDTIDFTNKNNKWEEFQQNYQGICILTPHAVKKLKDQASVLSNDIITELVKPLKNVNVLSQSLSGFNDALLMQDQTMQFDVHDPLAKTRRERDFHEKVKDVVDKYDDSSPDPNKNFNPIRAGFMKIEKIEIVDTFGQYRRVNPSRTYPGRSLKPAKPKKYGDCFLPPRIVQASRLNFNWLSANGNFKTTENPNTNPICGWILSNHLENSIAIYNSNGKCLGSIFAGKKNPLTFKSSPGSGHENYEDAMSDTNSYLKEFIDSLLYKKDIKYFKNFVNTINRALNYVEPETYTQDENLALFISRPVAITRTVLNLELKGEPVLNQSWNSLILNIKDEDGKKDSSEFTNVEFPIRLGSTEKNNEYNDGLIGYFRAIDNKNDFETFYTFHADKKNNKIVKPDNNTIRLNAAGATQTLFILIDPGAKLHATSGILPRKCITIPEEFYKDAINSMEITFSANHLIIKPVIVKPAEDETEKDNYMEIPIPSEKGYEWAWIEKDNNVWVVQRINDVEDNKAILCNNQQIKEGWLKLSKVTSNSE